MIFELGKIQVHDDYDLATALINATGYKLGNIPHAPISVPVKCLLAD